MLGVLRGLPPLPRFRAGRGIAIAVVTVASLGVGGLAAAGPGVFQAAASKARSFVTDDSAETSADAGAANGGDPHRGSLLDDTNGVGSSAAALALAAAQQAATSGDCSGVPCALGASLAGAVTPTAPPPECAEGNHGDAVAVVANSSVPPSAEQDHANVVSNAADDACTPTGPQGNAATDATNPNKPEDTPAGPPSSTASARATDAARHRSARCCAARYSPARHRPTGHDAAAPADRPARLDTRPGQWSAAPARSGRGAERPAVPPDNAPRVARARPRHRQRRLIDGRRVASAR